MSAPTLPPTPAWRWRLRTWSPDYDDARLEAGASPASDAAVDPAQEVPTAHWAAKVVPERPAPVVSLVDGVQRVDAWADLESGDGTLGEALFASYLAGAVRCVAGRPAEVVVRHHVQRAIFGAGAGAPVGGYERNPSDAPVPYALQSARDAVEIEVAAAEAADGALVVADGPLHGRGHLAATVGFIKSHRAEYLTDAPLRAVVTGLEAGERTPLFRIDTGWTRWAWYLRLPGGAPPGWAGIARCEASADLSVDAAAALADRATATVIRFASSPVKDSRAPQNLVPVGGLERLLRHRLGDRDRLERRLRTALRPDATPVAPTGRAGS
jgi:hypothetical protein